ncbi:hypothetical protein [Labrenzia sp. CE80]|uniref:hypothetical protein n=1 Tax=Labrenzia sp. CE80 TaxID=1788986 RepID=UPI00129BC710|nr:hypothetical protein [Labrenzia sp. CE80]
MANDSDSGTVEPRFKNKRAENAMLAETLEETIRRAAKTPYLAEQLFVFGMRCVQNGYDNQYLDHWCKVWVRYSADFGENNCRSLLDALWEFVRVYRWHASDPTGHHCLECPCMARDEYLSMALISALQHQDVACSGKCLREIAPVAGLAELERRAWQLAAEYLSLGQRFLPVSLTDVETTLLITDALRDASTATLH